MWQIKFVLNYTNLLNIKLNKSKYINYIKYIHYKVINKKNFVILLKYFYGRHKTITFTNIVHILIKFYFYYCLIDIPYRFK